MKILACVAFVIGGVLLALQLALGLIGAPAGWGVGIWQSVVGFFLLGILSKLLD